MNMHTSALAAMLVLQKQADIAPIVGHHQKLYEVFVPLINVSAPLLDFCASRITPASLSVFWNVDI